eukprot:3052715-Amphidinium_carterae.1
MLLLAIWHLKLLASVALFACVRLVNMDLTCAPTSKKQAPDVTPPGPQCRLMHKQPLPAAAFLTSKADGTCSSRGGLQASSGLHQTSGSSLSNLTNCPNLAGGTWHFANAHQRWHYEYLLERLQRWGERGHVRWLCKEVKVLGVARSAGTQVETRRLRTYPPCNHCCKTRFCCATARTGIPPDSRSARPFVGASEVPCRQNLMDQQAKIAQDATNKREQLRRNWLRLFELGKAPYRAVTSAQNACSTLWRWAWCTGPAPCSTSVLDGLHEGKEGDREAQNIYEQISLSREMEQLQTDLEGNGEPATENNLLAGEDASMQDA